MPDAEQARETFTDPSLAGLDGQEPDSLAPPSTRKVVGRAAVVILAATVVGRLIGLVRDQAVAYFFGAGATTDAFFLAYKLPYLLSLTVAGALTATFIPVFTQRYVTGRQQEAWDLSVSVTNAAALILLAVTAVCLVFAAWLVPLFGPGFDPSTTDLAVSLFRILMLGLVFAGLAGLAIGILNSLKRFGLAAFSPAVGSFVAIAFMAFFAASWGISSLAWGTTVGAVASFAVLLPQMRRAGWHWRPAVDWRMPGMGEVGTMIWPILIGSAVGKVSIFVDQVLGSLLGEGAVSALNYSDKLFQMPLGLFVAGITIPIFPLLSEHVAHNQPEKLKATLNFAMRLIAYVLVPCSVGLIVLRVPIVALLFQHGKFTAEDTTRTSWALFALSLGLLSYAMRDTLTRVFYAYHDTRTPVKISVIAVVINIVCSYLLMQVIGIAGLTMGTTIALTVNFLVLVQLLRRKLGPMGFGAFARSLGRTLVVSLVMGAVVWGVDTYLAGRLTGGTLDLLVRVIVDIAVGVVVFAVASWVGQLPELREIVDMFKAIVPRRPGGQESAA